MIEWKRDSQIHPERVVLRKMKEKFNCVSPKLKSRWLFSKLIRNKKKLIKIDWCKQKSWVKDMLQYLSISAYLRRSRAVFKILSLLFSGVTPPRGGDFSRFCFLRLSPRAAWSSARGARESYRFCKNNTMAIQRSFFRPTRNSKTKNH